MVDTGITGTSYSFIATCKYRLPCGRCEKTMLMCPENESITIDWTNIEKTTPIDPREWTITTTNDINSDKNKMLKC